MDYIRFFRDNIRLISFGIVLTFFSSFGQTFLISLYVPSLQEVFRLSGTAFGGIYAIATLVSAAALIYFGSLIDRMNLKIFSLATALLLMASCVLMAAANSFPLLLVGIFGLRLAGQGLLSHIALTSMSRYYDEHRGKALSISVLGYAFGEAVFPLLIGLLIGSFDWRLAMLFSAGLIGTLLIPAILVLLKNVPAGIPRENHTDLSSGAIRRALLKDKSFYIITLNSFMLPFIITGLLFYQLIMAGEKGWSVEWVAVSFIAFAISRTVFSLAAGPLVDKFSARRVFPYYLLPFLAGLFILPLSSHPYIAVIYFVCAGISIGLSGSVKSALLAEVYGTRNLGAVRSVYSSLMVFSTAVGPVALGVLLDFGLKFDHIAILCGIVLSGAVAISFRLNAGTRFQTPVGEA